MRRLVAAGAFLLLAGCGSDGSGDAPAARVVEVKALDTLRFDPSTLSAKAGEAVEFRVTNTGATAHEFVIGDADYHAAHEEAAASGGSHAVHAGKGKGAAVEVAPGETKTLAYTMPDAAPTYACHIAAHDDAGMKGSVTY